MGLLSYTTLMVLIVGMAASLHQSSINKRNSVTLTIYNNDFAMIKDLRTISFDSGLSNLYFDDVASTIQTQTVTFRPVNKNITIGVIEQNYQNNLVSKEALLKKFVNKKVNVQQNLGTNSKTIEGILLASDPTFLLKTSTGVKSVEDIGAVNLPDLPQGFLLTPTLVWKVLSKQKVSTECVVAYRATGFSWKATYLITLVKDTLISLNGWVTIDNYSGKDYAMAKVKLIAGVVNTVQEQPEQEEDYEMAEDATDSGAAAAPVEEKSFGDYHMYTLTRMVNVNQSESKQVEFIPLIENIPVNKFYRIQISTGCYQQSDLAVKSIVEFNNSKSNRVGMALPQGTINVFMQDPADGGLEFIGSDSIDHTPKDQNVTIVIGSSFDITAKKTIVSRRQLGRGFYGSSKLSINNHSDKTVSVVLKLTNGYGDNLKIQSKQKFLKKDAGEYEIRLDIGANKSTQIEWEQSYSL